MTAITQAAHADAPHHDETNYVAIWGVLCALLVVSVLGPMLGVRLVTLITAFGIAIVKAYMVCRYFMHLSIEKKWVAYILGFMLALMLVFFGGVAPDVSKDQGLRWQKTYVEPTTAGGER
jgi:caa(3)-type oxidase subunit IV